MSGYHGGMPRSLFYKAATVVGVLLLALALLGALSGLWAIATG